MHRKWNVLSKVVIAIWWKQNLWKHGVKVKKNFLCDNSKITTNYLSSLLKSIVPVHYNFVRYLSLLNWVLFASTTYAEQCHEFFDPPFFINQPPLGPDHALKPCRIWLRICRDIRFRSQFFRWSSPLIFAFSSSYMYAIFTYAFVFAIASL
jgi:hypothetical protein